MQRISGVGEIAAADPAMTLQAFVKSAESAVELASTAIEHADKGDCSNANRFAFRATEEIGSVRGLMTQIATEIRITKNKHEKAKLKHALSAMRHDLLALEGIKTEMFSKRCFRGTEPLPFAVTSRPSDGEEDG
jgi:hypothetical protein